MEIGFIVMLGVGIFLFVNQKAENTFLLEELSFQG